MRAEASTCFIQIVNRNCSQQVEPSPADFHPPADMFCEGRDTTMGLPSLPSHYKFGSEVVTQWHLDPLDPYLKVVQPRDEW